jgi:hypothetical protein
MKQKNSRRRGEFLRGEEGEDGKLKRPKVKNTNWTVGNANSNVETLKTQIQTSKNANPNVENGNSNVEN